VLSVTVPFTVRFWACAVPINARKEKLKFKKISERKCLLENGIFINNGLV
jgi:hypothetical protein